MHGHFEIFCFSCSFKTYISCTYYTGERERECEREFALLQNSERKPERTQIFSQEREREFAQIFGER